MRAALAWQFAATLLIAAIAGPIGGIHAAVSAALGGAVVIGANIAYGVPRLRSGNHVGDPVDAGTSIDSLTTDGVVAVPYISFTLSGDVFADLRGFSSQ